MKFTLLAVISIFLLFFDFLVPKPDKKVVGFLGKDICKVIQQSKIVKSYLLDPVATSTDTTPKFGGIPIFQKGKNLTISEADLLKKIVFNSKNYGLDSIVKNCVFTPGVGLEFIAGVQKVQLLICYECNEWRFVYKGKQKHEDCDPARFSLVPLAKSIFPKDEIIQQLTIK